MIKQTEGEFLEAFSEYLRIRGIGELTRKQYVSKAKELAQRVGVIDNLDSQTLLIRCQKFVADHSRSVPVAKTVVKHYLFYHDKRPVFQDFIETVGRGMRQPPRKQLNKSVPQQKLSDILSLLPERVRLILKIEYEACFRIKAVLSLKRENITWDKDKKLLLISQKDKGGKAKNSYITEKTSLQLWELIKDMKPEDTIFPEFNYRRIVYLLDKHRAGIKTHHVRHSRTMHLLDDGVPIQEVKELMGHESITTTMKYVAAQGNKSKEIIQKHTPDI